MLWIDPGLNRDSPGRGNRLPRRALVSEEFELMRTGDVLIVGAGMAGASAAYELAAFARVILLERESQPGYHSTGRSAAVFAPGYGNRVIRALTAASRQFYEERAGGLADYPVLSPRGALLVARADQIASLDAGFAEAGVDMPDLERLDPAETRRRLPALREDYVAGGVVDPSAMDMDVAAIHQGYLKGFRARGGQVVSDAEVRAFDPDAPPWRIETMAGTFEAAVVVDAAGAWADQVAELAGIQPVGLVPKRRTAFLFEPSMAPDPAWPALIDADEQFYFKPESGLLLGSPADETPMPPCDVQPEELDIALAVDRIERAAAFQVRRVPRKWAGLRSFVADKTPVVGMEEAVPGFFWLAGQGGYGIQTAPAMARAAAGLVVEGALPADLLALGVRPEDLMPSRLRRSVGRKEQHGV